MITILSAPIHSGKTTALMKWSETHDVKGILSPVVNGKRIFMDAGTKEQFPMEVPRNEEGIEIGRFWFSKKGFEKAAMIILDAIDSPGWLVIDEVGPLELKGEGFHDVLNEVLDKRTERIILTVREGLTQKVKDHFGIRTRVIDNINKL